MYAGNREKKLPTDEIRKIAAPATQIAIMYISTVYMFVRYAYVFVSLTFSVLDWK